MDAGIYALIGAGIGALGASLAQWVSARFSADREHKKATLEREASIDARFFPHRIEKYGQFSALARRVEQYLRSPRPKDEDLKQFAQSGGDGDRLRELGAELDLMSPARSKVFDKLTDTLESMMIAHITMEYEEVMHELSALRRTYKEQVETCQREMRQQLGLMADT